MTEAFLMFIGVLVVTGLMLVFTVWLYGLLFTSVAFAGWASLKDGWYYAIGYIVLNLLGWALWWHFIGSAINVNINVN